jgi:hypothetical protein
MNRIVSTSRKYALHAFGAVAFTLVAVGASAQDTTTTSTRQGVSAYQANVRNAEIVYVEGNDLVLKLEDGRIEHLVVPASEKFRIDGKDVTVRELKAGTRLTQTITTTTTPHYVQTVRVLKGKVWHVNSPHSVILTLPDGTNQQYKIPEQAKFTINGQKKSAFDLRKGMVVEATIVTDEERTVVENTKSNVGYTPAPTPQFVDVLLIQAVPMPAPVKASVSAEHVDAPVETASATLPNTASPLPLLGLLGGLSIASSIGLGLARKRAVIKA